MKAKTLMGMIAFASASVSLSAFANTTNGWFGVTVSDETATYAHIAKNDKGTVANSKISLTDVEQEDALVFTPDSSCTITNNNDGIYVIGASVALVPCSTNDFVAPVENAKAGIVAGIDGLGATNYYGYADGTWNKLSGVDVVESGDTTFRIVLNYRDTPKKVYFYIGEGAGETAFGPYEMDDTDGATALANIQAWGTGSISSVTGGYEVAVAAYNDIKYGSIAEATTAATTAGETSADVQGVSPTGDIQEKSATAENGMSYVVCEALGLSTTDPTANIAVAPVAVDSATDKITLELTTQNLGPEAGLVGYEVYLGNVKKGSTYNADGIQIPLEAGTYTIKPVLK